MSELDLRGNTLISPGIHIDGIRLEGIIYDLISTIGASKFLYNNFSDEVIFETAKIVERSKISELLISIAVISRNLIDLPSNFENLPVGSIRNKGKDEDLLFRKSCNKIIHSVNISFDIEKGNNIKDGYLNPTVYLYGNYHHADWKVKLDVVKFCKSASCLVYVQ